MLLGWPAGLNTSYKNGGLALLQNLTISQGKTCALLISVQKLIEIQG